MRVGTSKVRTGCSTCKRRHIKCDETRPTCAKCIQRGYHCTYELPKKLRVATRFVHYVPRGIGQPLVSHQGLPQEARALEFFRVQTARDLAYPFCANLWSRHSMLLAEYETSVRHALVALGGAHEHFLSGGTSLPEASLVSYNQAISLVVELWTANSSRAPEVALVTSIIFASLEILRGCYRSAINIVTLATKVLCEIDVGGGVLNNAILPLDTLRWHFTRFTSQVVDVGGSGYDTHEYYPRGRRDPILETFPNPDAGMMTLETLYSQLSDLYQRMDRAGPEPYLQTHNWELLVAEMQQLREDYDRWRKAFLRFQAEARARPTTVQAKFAVSTIELLSHVVGIMLDLDLLSPEDDFDRHFSTFKAIVDGAESIISGNFAGHSMSRTSSSSSGETLSTEDVRGVDSPESGSVTSDRPLRRQTTPPRFSTSAPPFFTLNAVYVGPLYFVAARCRNSAVRHRALGLLKGCRRREGLWNSELATLIAEKVISIEEGAAVPSSMASQSTNANSDIRTSDPIPLVQDRVKLVNTSWGEDDGGSAAFTTQYAGSVTVGDRFSGLEFTELASWGASETESRPIE